MPQLKTLLLLVEGPVRMGEIADHLSVSMPTATGIVDRLSSAGLVTREHDTPDRRVVLCNLTEQGRKRATAMWNSRVDMMKDILGTLSASDLEVVVNAITMMLSAAKESATQRQIATEPTTP